MTNLIEIENLTKDYGDEKGIFNISLEVKQGEVFGIVGVNGAGKTTIIRHLMGFIKSNRGKAFIDGKDCWKKSAILKKNIGYVPGEISYPQLHTGEDFLKLQSHYLEMENMEYANELARILQLDTKASLKRMSKGMKQKTALVSGFMKKPSVLILDEPTTGLDPLMRKTFINLLLQEKKNGTTIFMSSPMFDELEAVCDRVAFIKNGKILEIIEMKEFTKNQKVKEYKIEFMNERDYIEFLSEGFDVVRKQEKYRQVTIIIEDSNLKILFHSLSKKDLKFITHIPLTLESYFQKNIMKER